MPSKPIKIGLLHANLSTWVRRLMWHIAVSVFSLVIKYISSVNFAYPVYQILLTNPNPSYLGSTTTKGV
jgi:hypothetical protein